MERGYKDIFRRQTFTLFNLVNVILAAAILWTGSWQNLFFMGTVVTNWLIGIIQEVRARKILNSLALMHQDKYTRLTGDKREVIPLSQIRAGDRLVIVQGDQIPCDGTIEAGSLELNESLLTGESDLVHKGAGDAVLSGTFVDSGTATVKVDKAGSDTYVSGLERRALVGKAHPSPLRDALDKIIKFCTIAIFPMGILLFVRSLASSSVKAAILHTSAALIGMIPEGLVVLTSIALAIASVRLAKEQVLVQQLYCSETLARTDILCMDKTGTLTTGRLTVNELVPAASVSKEYMSKVLAQLYAAVPDTNATAMAIRAKFGHEQTSARNIVPFSSRTRYSSATIDGKNYVAGAVQTVAKEQEADAEVYASQGYRVLALTEDDRFLGFVLLSDQLKADVQQTMAYFKSQDVELCVISGDDPATVQHVANEAGIAGTAISMADVSADAIPELMKTHRIFGRVDPEQKALMVKALESQSHTVAMTGDGVNDVLALKEADCSIAMGSGSQAARCVASLILLDDQFDDLPQIVLQGRRTINNIQRTASLFLVKTMFSFVLALLTLVLFKTYPFQPVQLTLISALATGIPSFVLTLEPNDRRVTGDFLRNVLIRALPGATNISAFILIAWFLIPDKTVFSTVCTFLAGVNSLSVLVLVCRPMTPIRIALVFLMTICFIGAVWLFPNILMLVPLSGKMFTLTVMGCLLEPFTLYLLAKKAGQ